MIEVNCGKKSKVGFKPSEKVLVALRGVYNLPFNLDDPVHPLFTIFKEKLEKEKNKSSGWRKNLCLREVPYPRNEHQMSEIGEH